MDKKNSPFWAALLTSLAAAFLLCGYEFLRSTSNSLYAAQFGTENLPVVQALMPLGLLVLIYIYSWLLSWIGPKYTLLVTTLLSGIVIVACYLAIQKGVGLAVGLLYIYREAYIVLIIEQYWSFLNSSFGEQAARKFNGPVTGIASLGAILAGYLLHYFTKTVGTHQMVLFAGLATLPAALLSHIAYIKCGEPVPTEAEKKESKGHLGLSLFKTEPILLLIIVLVMTTQVVSTVLGLQFQTYLHATYPNMDDQTAYSGRFYANLNILATVLQFGATPLVLKLLPMWLIHMFIPLIHLGACGFALFSPSIGSIGLAFMLFKAFDYSIFRAAKEILYIPLSFNSRYRAKEIIDVFGYRTSKGLTSLSLVFLKHFGVLIESLYSWIALSAAAIWLGLILPLAIRIKKQQSSAD